MRAWLRFFRVTVGNGPSLPTWSFGRNFGADVLNAKWSSSTNCLGHSHGTRGREAVTLGVGLASASVQKKLGVEATSLARPNGGIVPAPGSVWSSLIGPVRFCQKGELSRQRVPKSAAINDNIMPNTTHLKYGLFGIRALSGRRVAANTLEAVRRTLRRKLKKTARLWVRIEATVPVTRKPLNVRMGKGKGAIAFYATAVRPGQIIYEMDRVPRTVALQAMQAAQHKFPVKLGFVEWS